MRKLMLLVFLLAIAVCVHADPVTMTLNSVGSSVSTPPGGNILDGGYTYPYFFSVADPSSTYTSSSVALICDDYTSQVKLGESWTANVFTLDQAASGSGKMTVNPNLVTDGILGTSITTAQAYWAAAYLFQELLNYGTSPTSPTATESEAFNVAIWGLFSDAAYTNAPSLFTSTYDLGALGTLTLDSLIQSAYNSTKTGYTNPNIVFYTPANPPNIKNGCTTPDCAIPQEYMGDPAPLSEPASLLLLGTGLLGLAWFSRRKIRS